MRGDLCDSGGDAGGPRSATASRPSLLVSFRSRAWAFLRSSLLIGPHHPVSQEGIQFPNCQPERRQSEQAVGHRESCSVYGSGLQGGHEARGAPTPLVRPEQGLWRGLSLASLPPRLPTSQSCVLIHHRFPPWTPVAPNRRSSPDHLSFPCSSDHDDSPDLNNIAHAIPNATIWQSHWCGHPSP